ncbi:MAG: hypothetical protein ACE5Q6_14190 [Dehalococcoidia bacterium]
MILEPEGVYLRLGEGGEIRVPGHPIIMPKLVGADTGGAYSLLEMTIQDEDRRYISTAPKRKSFTFWKAQ